MKLPNSYIAGFLDSNGGFFLFLHKYPRWRVRVLQNELKKKKLVINLLEKLKVKYFTYKYKDEFFFEVACKKAIITLIKFMDEDCLLYQSENLNKIKKILKLRKN